MAEDHRSDANGAASGFGEGGLGIYVRRGGLQSGADEEPAGQLSWCRMSQGRSVPTHGKVSKKMPQIQALRLSKRQFEAIRSSFDKI